MTAKTVYDDTILIDAYEHRTLAAFETLFSMLVWFACVPPDEPHAGYLFFNRDLARVPVSTVKGKPVIAVPLRVTKTVDERRDFMAAVLGAIGLR